MCNLKIINRIAAIISKIKIITSNVLLRDFLKSLLHSAPMPSAGREKPPIIIATNFAIGIKIIAGRKMIAWALGAENENII